MPLFVRRADAIIAVSRHTKRDILDLYGTPPQKVFVVGEGIEDHFRPVGAEEIRRVLERLAIRRPYLLMVGTLEPRKNHALAFEALARLKAEGWPHCLVVGGRRGWLFDAVQSKVEQLGLAEDVIFTGRVPDAELPALYSGADCFLMPSLYEGFGIPVLEAMACGAPVVCSTASSLPEVAGEAALYIDSMTGEGLAAAIRQVLSEPKTAEQMRSDGLRQAARFSWRGAAIATVDVYNAVARGSYLKPLRICMVSKEYPPTGTGGIASYVFRLAHGLAEAGHDVTVIAGPADSNRSADRPNGPRNQDQESSGLRPCPPPISRPQ